MKELEKNPKCLRQWAGSGQAVGMGKTPYSHVRGVEQGLGVAQASGADFHQPSPQRPVWLHTPQYTEKQLLKAVKYAKNNPDSATFRAAYQAVNFTKSAGSSNSNFDC